MTSHRFSETVLPNGRGTILSRVRPEDEMFGPDDPDVQVIARNMRKEKLTELEWRAMWDAHESVIHRCAKYKNRGTEE